MNWIQLRAEQAPVNLDQIVSFQPSQSYIVFYTHSGTSISWDYSDQVACNLDFLKLLDFVGPKGRRTTND